MKTLKLFLVLSFFFTLSGYSSEPIPDSTNDYLITISTQYGDMKMILFDDTPKHKKNFVKLAKAGVYDHIIFHRVIDHFMIQTGDFKTRNKERNYDVTIIPQSVPAEIKDHHKHAYGSVAAARRGDKVNPERKSSGTQFYIVENKKGTPHLDGKYTVFGQVMSGLSVIDSVAAQPTSERDSPKQDIRMTVKVEKVKRENVEKFYNFEY